ncbi:hypothetical protein BGZ58_003986 [Dissophora ornata]|nr:hypothetical protein BGZ58_003986 [Dissophora ornata]
MSTTIVGKYQTLKQSKAIKLATSEDIFSQHQPKHQPKHQHQHLKSASSYPALNTSTLSGSLLESKPSYSLFIAELISTFNSLSTSLASPTSSSTLHTFFQGADHEAHVNGHQKKKVVSALQHADAAKVNEVILILKAMPDPTKLAATTTNTKLKQKKSSRAEDDKENKHTEKQRIKKQKQERLDSELTEWDKIDKSWGVQKSNDQTTGVVDPESCIGPSSASWWFSYPPPTYPPPPAPIHAIMRIKDAKETRTGFGSIWLATNTKPSVGPSATKKPLTTGEQIAQAAASLLAMVAVSDPKELKSDASNKDDRSNKTSTIRRQSSMPIIRSASLKALLPTRRSPLDCTTSAIEKQTAATEVAPTTPSYLVATINSITRQFLALQQRPPPTHTISAYTFWWGFEIYVPHKCMQTIERVSNTSQTFFNILSGAVSGIPGLEALVPIAKIIAAWVGYQWSVIKAEDQGKGVVISATWVLPVALASRPWDYPSKVADPSPSSLQPKKTLKSKFRLIRV